MDGAIAQTIGGKGHPAVVHSALAIAAGYALFFALWLALDSVHPSPALTAGAWSMALSAAVWSAAGVYRLVWTAVHARNQTAILTRAGDPALEFDAYRRIVEASSRRLTAVEVAVVFLCLPLALLSASLTLTAWAIALAGA
jgi:hypothetical protein